MGLKQKAKDFIKLSKKDGQDDEIAILEQRFKGR